MAPRSSRNLHIPSFGKKDSLRSSFIKKSSAECVVANVESVGGAEVAEGVDGATLKLLSSEQDSSDANPEGATTNINANTDSNVNTEEHMTAIPITPLTHSTNLTQPAMTTAETAPESTGKKSKMPNVKRFLPSRSKSKKHAAVPSSSSEDTMQHANNSHHAGDQSVQSGGSASRISADANLGMFGPAFTAAEPTPKSGSQSIGGSSLSAQYPPNNRQGSMSDSLLNDDASCSTAGATHTSGHTSGHASLGMFESAAHDPSSGHGGGTSVAGSSVAGGGSTGTGNKIVRMDKYGFLLDDPRSSSDEKKKGGQLSRVSDALDTMTRVKKWENMLNQIPKETSNDKTIGNMGAIGGGFSNTQSKVKYYTRRGLPDAMRQRAWTVLTGVDIIMSEREGEYQDLVTKASEEYEKLNGIMRKRASMELMESGAGYGHLNEGGSGVGGMGCGIGSNGEEDDRRESLVDTNLSQTVDNSYLETIERDIHRTFPKHYLFHDGLDDDTDDGQPSNGGGNGSRRNLGSSIVSQEGEEVVHSELDSDDEDDDDKDSEKDTSSHPTESSIQEDSELNHAQTEEEKEQQDRVIAEAKKQLFNDMIGRSNAQMTAQMTTFMSKMSCGGLHNTLENKGEGGRDGQDLLMENDQHQVEKPPTHSISAVMGDNLGDGASVLSDSGGDSNLPTGQAALRRVLRAYSMYDAEVGYCQGMNFIAAMFLTFLSEEEAFWLLVVVMNEEPYKLRELFGEDMAGTHEVLYIAEKLIHQFLPKLSQHMENENIHISMFVTQWLLTIYTSTFPFELVARVWDCFLVEGWKVVYRVMLALLEHASKDLMGLHFEQILNYFRDFPQTVDGGQIMNGSLKIALKRKHIQKHVNEWRRTAGLVAGGDALSSKMNRRDSTGSSASSTLNSVTQGGTRGASVSAVKKALLKRTPKEIIVEDLSGDLIPIIGTAKFAVLLHNVLSFDECSELIERMEQDGFQDASIYNPRTKEVLRNCTRCVMDDAILAENWFERIVHALKGTELEKKIKYAPWHGTGKGNKNLHAVSLNERFRVLKYSSGQYFMSHNDARFVRGPDAGDRAGETSHVSVQIYLNDKFKGGTTRFREGKRYLDVVPKTGSVLIFDHNILHEGCKVTHGKKYLIRSDIMYSDRNLTGSDDYNPYISGAGFTQQL